MNHRFPARVCVALSLAVALARGPLEAAEPGAPADVATLRDKLQEINALRRERMDLALEQRRELDQHETHASRLTQQLTGVREQVTRLEAECRELESRLAAERASILSQEAVIDAVAAAAKPIAPAVESRVSRGIPFQLAARKAQASGATADLASDDAARRARAVAALAGFLTEELRLAATRQLIAQPIPLDNAARRVEAYQLRLGLVSQLFMSEDRAEVGYASGGESAWTPITAPDQRAMIVRAVEQARQVRPPSLEPVPTALRRDPVQEATR